jgi:non-heme chloroperoxidase
MTERETEQIDRANATDRAPVVFIHGLWLLPNCWERWTTIFEEAGYAAVTPGWPDDPETVGEARAHPEVFARKKIEQIADRYAEIIGRLSTKPAIIGHSFGGLLTMIMAGRGLSSASVAISPAPFRGVLPVPIAALRASSPVLRNPANRKRAVGLTYEQFRYAFANAIGTDEAKQLYETYSVPGSGAMIFQAATANLNPLHTGEGRQQEPEPRAAADHVRQQRSHGSVVHCERRIQEAAPQRRCHRDRQGLRSGALTHDRQRLARGCSHGTRVRQALRLGRPRGRTRRRRAWCRYRGIRSGRRRGHDALKPVVSCVRRARRRGVRSRSGASGSAGRPGRSCGRSSARRRRRRRRSVPGNRAA